MNIVVLTLLIVVAVWTVLIGVVFLVGLLSNRTKNKDENINSEQISSDNVGEKSTASQTDDVHSEMTSRIVLRNQCFKSIILYVFLLIGFFFLMRGLFYLCYHLTHKTGGYPQWSMTLFGSIYFHEWTAIGCIIDCRDIFIYNVLICPLFIMIPLILLLKNRKSLDSTESSVYKNKQK